MQDLQRTFLSSHKRGSASKILNKQWDLHVMVVPALACLIIFSYMPIYGIIIAFKDFTFRQGILGSEWVGLKHFYNIVSDPFVHRALVNTVLLSLLRLMLLFPAPIVLALMLNEMRFPHIKKVFQTISYFPFFCFMILPWQWVIKAST